MKADNPNEKGLHYQNGQSDAEKLMREHLQNPDHQITDEDLKNIKLVDMDSTEEAAPPAEDEEDAAHTPGKPITPWDTIEP